MNKSNQVGSVFVMWLAFWAMAEGAAYLLNTHWALGGACLGLSIFFIDHKPPPESY